MVDVDVQGTHPAAGWRLIESEVRATLAGVQLVFETGFPPEIVEQAQSVIEEAQRERLLVHGVKVLYPACWVMTAVSLARRYDGSSFWSGIAQEIFRLEPTKIADHTIWSMRKLDLDTFENATRVENALKKLTPVLMHAGVPAPNVGEVVRQIGIALRQHQFLPEDQIAYWERTRSGYGGIWRAPQILFRHGGAIAEDLLEQFNIATGPDGPEESGLPSHLAEAVAALDLQELRSIRGSSGSRVPRPRFCINPYALSGPYVSLPIAKASQVEKWEIVGATERSAYVSDLVREISLLPEPFWSVRALRGTDQVDHLNTAPFGELPVILFDGRAPHPLLRRTKQRVDVPSATVLALMADGVAPLGAVAETTFPALVGEWQGCTVVELSVRELGLLEFQETQGAERRKETIILARPPVRPHLEIDAAIDGLHTGSGGLVYGASPILRCDIVGNGAAAVKVLISHSGTERSYSLDDLASLGEGRFSLAGLLPSLGDCSLSMAGPLGAQMKKVSFAVIEGVEIRQTPQLSIDETPVKIEVITPSEKIILQGGSASTSIAASLAGIAIDVQVRRLKWALRTASEVNPRMDSLQFSIAADELLDATATLLTIDFGSPLWSRIELRNGGEVLQQLVPSKNGLRGWTANLSDLLDTVRASVSDALQVVLIAGNQQLEIGRIISQYLPSDINATADSNIEPACIEISFSENRAFANRVVRVWNLDRPWEPSQPFPLAEDERSSAVIRFEPGHRQGNYRLMLRVEEPWALAPPFPDAEQNGVVDVAVASGKDLDADDPIDRIIGVATGRSGFVLLPDDMSEHGDVAIALLDGCFRDEGARGFSGHKAISILNLLDSSPHSAVRNLFSALGNQRIGRNSAFPISLALLPTLLANEAELDLELEESIADEVWSKLPWVAATIESWDESAAANERWRRTLGWPITFGEEAVDLIESESSDDATSSAFHAEEGEIVGGQSFGTAWDLLNLRPSSLDAAAEDGATYTLPALPSPGPAFETHARLVIERPELRQVLADLVGSLSRQALTIDGQMRAICNSITAVTDAPQQLEEWRERYHAVVERVNKEIPKHAFQWVKSLQVRGVDKRDAQGRWVLADIAELALGLVHSRGERTDARDALLDASEFLGDWVKFAIFYALASDNSRRKYGIKYESIIEENADEF